MNYAEAEALREADDRSLGFAFLESMQRGPRHTALIDPTGAMSRVRLAAAALSLRDLLDEEIGAQRVGVLLPPGKGGAVVNLALALAGKVSVNLNHTAGSAQLKRMCEIAEVTTVITAQKYLDKISDPPELPGRVLLADQDLLPRVSKLTTMGRMARLPLLSHSKLREYDRAHSTDVATIVFSSGTTGDPKAIQLTHAQILANIEAARRGLDLHEAHVMLTSLPLFHSFGLVPGFWLGLATGVTISAYPNPRDPAGYGRHAEKTSATCMLSTPTFCRQYLKKIPPQNFATMQFAIVAAEKCPAELKTEFYDRYKVVLHEGYGCTELAPIVSTNAPGPDAARAGSVGRAVPGVEILIVNPETLAELPRGAEGLIIVRSPARMLGYLGRDDLTAQAFVLGGYHTGDMGRLDEDGFLYITGRLARFAKIGGEMIPLDTLEDRLDSYLRRQYGSSDGDDASESTYEVAVAAIPDRTKGERLVLLYTTLPPEVQSSQKSLGDFIEAALAEFPPLFRPRSRDSYAVEALPTLGSGKRDLKAIKTLALEQAGAALPA